MVGEYFDDLMNVKACFIGDKDYPEYDFNIFLLCRREDSKEYNSFKRLTKKKSNFVKFYQADNFHDMFVFNVPEKFYSDFEIFKNSKYSRLSPYYKEHILGFHNIRGDHSVTRVLYKDERQRKKIELDTGVELKPDEEVASLLRDDQEIYNEDMKVKTNLNNSDLIKE